VNYTTVHDVIPMSGFFYFKLPTNQKWCTASESTPGAAAAATATTIDTTTATITTTAAAAAAANIINQNILYCIPLGTFKLVKFK